MVPEVLYAPTQDGWQLAIHFWPARRQQRRYPVLMVHGLAANRLHLDMDERHSAAQAARQRGFNVYVLELRGAGMSRTPTGRDRALFEWGFGDHVSQDLPAAVAKVTEHSGTTGLHAFGHCLGGMLWVAAAVGRPTYLRSLTLLGTPLVSELVVGQRARRLLQLGAKLVPAAGLTRVPIGRLVSAAGHLVSLSARLVDGILINRGNCDDEVVACVARAAAHEIPSKLLAEIDEQLDHPHSPAGPFAYECMLDRISVPVLAVSGSADCMATPASVAALSARLYSLDVRYREMGKAWGDAADYGHADLLVGNGAPSEVFPILMDFLEEVD